jgi:hypothetical protein
LRRNHHERSEDPSGENEPGYYEEDDEISAVMKL